MSTLRDRVSKLALPKLTIQSKKDANKICDLPRIQEMREADVAKKYKLGEMVMESTNRGMDVIFAERRKDGTQVVIKTRLKSCSFSSLKQEREWRMSMEQQLNMPRVESLCQLFEVLETPVKYYIVMEKVPGRDIFEQMCLGRPKMVDSREIVRQILVALAALHASGRIHKDLKIENVVVDMEGNMDKVGKSQSYTLQDMSPKSPKPRKGGDKTTSLLPAMGLVGRAAFWDSEKGGATPSSSTNQGQASPMKSPTSMVQKMQQTPKNFSSLLRERYNQDKELQSPMTAPITRPKESWSIASTEEPTSSDGISDGGDEFSPVSPVASKIIDFDTVQEWEPHSPKPEDVVGTDGYIAPEAYLGFYSPASDIYAAGVIMYKLLTGKFPSRKQIFDDKPGENWVGSPAMKRIHDKLKNEKMDFKLHPLDKCPEAADLARGMMLFDAAARPSADQALKHPWFKMSHEDFPC
eukprot:TRINITY_DN13700_c0_g1_i1.p1 TRINITY_DN13700_c0_g1~~TRINITY_DN13700_c0_g1_i1.p1  ORF type:complete len:466 (+),score=131.77 TRINITY_DN13700_c0_g1_i1:108-1505(+)